MSIDKLIIPNPPEKAETVMELFQLILKCHQEACDDPLTGMSVPSMMADVEMVQNQVIRNYPMRYLKSLTIPASQVERQLDDCGGDYNLACMNLAMISQDIHQKAVKFIVNKNGNTIAADRAHTADINILRNWALLLSHTFNWPMTTADVMYLYMSGLGDQKLADYNLQYNKKLPS